MYAKVAVASAMKRTGRCAENGCRCMGVGDKPMRYCDLPVAGPEILGEIIRDLHCVFEKSYGRQATVEHRYRNLEGELQALRDDLMCCECCKEELENELIKLHPELKTLQFALEEEIQQRCCVESIANQLRAQLVRADAMLDADCRDKAAMQSKIKDLQAQIAKLQDMIMYLKGEREDLARNCKELEGRARTHISPDTLAAHGQRCEDLEDALAKCSRMNDALQKQIQSLEAANRKLKHDVNQLTQDKARLEDEIESIKKQAGKEIEYLQDLIRDFRTAIECLTSHNMEICEKFQEVVNGHQSAIQGLKNEIQKYKAMYETEAKLRAQCMESQERRYQESLTVATRSVIPGPWNEPRIEAPVIEFSNPCAALIDRLKRAPYSLCAATDTIRSKTVNISEQIQTQNTDSDEWRQSSLEKKHAALAVKSTTSKGKMSNKEKDKKVKLGAKASKTTAQGRNDRQVYAFHVVQGGVGGGESAISEESLKRRVTPVNRDLNGNSENESVTGASDYTIDDILSPVGGKSLDSAPSSDMMLKNKGKERMRGGEDGVKATQGTSDGMKDLEKRLTQSEKRSKFYAELYHRSREKASNLKMELILERGKASKLKQKLEGMKEQLRIAREKIQDFTNKHPELE